MPDLNGLRVSRETYERLEYFAQLFLKWSKTINLAAPSTLGDMWSRHVLDSVQIYALYPGDRNWIDLGSGGGFPGIVTAILLAETGSGWVSLVESNQKKAAFLRRALLETGGRGSVHPHRIEEAGEQLKTCDAISARALADLPTLLGYSSPWMLSPAPARAFFHKGRDYLVEVEKAHSEWDFDLVTHKSTIEGDSYVLEISNLVKKSN